MCMEYEEPAGDAALVSAFILLCLACLLSWPTPQHAGVSAGHALTIMLNSGHSWMSTYIGVMNHDANVHHLRHIGIQQHHT